MAFLRQFTKDDGTDDEETKCETVHSPREEKISTEFQQFLQEDNKKPRDVTINFRLHVTEKLPPTFKPGIRHVRCTSGLWNISERIMSDQTSNEDNRSNWYQASINIPQRSEFIWRWTMYDGEKVVDVEREVRKCKVGRYGGVLHTAWDNDVKIMEPDMCVVTFYTRYHISSDERLALIGSSDALGEWQPSRSVPAYQYPGGSCEWSVTLPLEKNLNQEWKWIVQDQYSHFISRWEDGRNREINGNDCDWKVVWAPWNSNDYITDYGYWDKMELSSLRLPHFLDCYGEG